MFLAFTDRLVRTSTSTYSSTMQNFRRVVNAALASRLKPSCTHGNSLAVSY